jgi:putative ABC transport system permease protein
VSVLQIPLGFDPEGVATIDVFPADLKGPEVTAFYQRAMSAIAANPDIASVGVVGSLPLGGAAPAEGVQSADPGARVGVVHVLPGYVETAGIELVRGRAHVESDVRSDPGAALVSRSAARVLFPGREALGESFTSTGGRRFHVVGVIADVRTQVSEEPPPLTYVLPADRVWPMTIVARTRVRQGGTLERLRQDVERATGATLRSVSAAWWADSIGTLADYKNPRFQTMILGAFAALALVLTFIGIFGVVAFLVAARTREMGVRLALGAAPGSLIRLMLGRVLPPVVAGVIVGLLATRWVSQLAEAQLFRVEARDPMMLAAAALLVAAAAALAAYLPARRASGVDPVITLRAE